MAVDHHCKDQARLKKLHEAAAVDAIDVAHQRLAARAARISDPGWRKSFCERVPENARTLGLMKLKTRPPEEE